MKTLVSETKVKNIIVRVWKTLVRGEEKIYATADNQNGLVVPSPLNSGVHAVKNSTTSALQMLEREENKRGVKFTSRLTGGSGEVQKVTMQGEPEYDNDAWVIGAG